MKSYARERAGAYPKIGEQLDALWKMIAHLSAEGVDIGEDATDMLERVQAVKINVPKRVSEQVITSSLTGEE